MHLPDQQQRTIYYPSQLAKEFVKGLEPTERVVVLGRRQLINRG